MALVDLLDAFASNEPVPGGGSAAALAGALGTSLLIMVAGLAKTRTGAPEEAADLAEASARLRPLRDSLLALVDDDSLAYRAVLDAMRLPKATDAEQTARRAAIDTAMQDATRVPLETMRFCQQALRGAIVVATHGNPNAAADTGTAVELLVAALRGAAMNVDVNLKDVSDAAFVARVAAERAQLAADAEADAEKVRST
jgi:formiminotetrahydrofolate cyclodeaminase